MIYSNILKNEKIQKALQDAGVDHIESPLMKDGDFSSFNELNDEVIFKIIDCETIARKRIIDLENLQRENEKKYAPQLRIKKKAEFIKPYIERVVSGNIADAYQSLEEGIVTSLSEKAALQYDYEPDGEVNEQPNYSGLSELERILNESSITHLSQRMSVEEIVLRSLHNSGFSKFLK